jgi:chemotaxis protein methyltransferase CheR
VSVTAASAPAGVERLRAVAAKSLGLRFDEGKSVFLSEVLQRRLDRTGLALDDYLLRLEGGGSAPDELRALAQELTVTETYFFRGVEQLRALVEVALPARARARARPGQTLRVLSAGCASGEEPYSLAMLLHGRPEPCPWNLVLQAIDVNTAMLKRAIQARYSAWALRETPPDIQARCFRADGREFVLDERFRRLVTFGERNLVQDDPAFWLPEAFDVVFCRNVLMYFSADVAAAVVARLTHSLARGGFLFLGYAETLRGLSQEFHLMHTHETFYYQRRQAWERLPAGEVSSQPSAWAAREQAGERAGATVVSAGAPSARTDTSDGSSQAPSLEAASLQAPLQALSSDVPSTSWFETIRLAAERVHSLTQAAAASSTPAGASPPARRGWDLGLALELMRQEKFSDALAVVKALPAESARDADVLLLQAVLLSHGGDLAAAEALCAEVLRLDEMSAGAHYLMALCREGAGDRAGAVEQDQTATYLDPAFAMPRLHLGLMARRSGDQEAARRELREAHRLLHGEDASRLLLFGGGFTREALIALCRGELAASGGAP